ncbi:MAG: hypothetical protein EAZ95_15050 [Bacteroidetes bacterium]|nr:MAG: hypothetical protein EAZ95_15050 [Bacteroidota bacterium]
MLRFFIKNALTWRKRKTIPIKSFEALGAKFDIEPTPIPETVGFLGRDKELQDIQTFLKSDKQVLEISGVPMIGKNKTVLSLQSTV